jgi:hypothetical protein
MLSSVRLFGSMARHDHDKCSDVDVLAVLGEPLHDAHEQHVRQLMGHFDCHRLSISWYSPGKITSMFSEGHLFAWHLYLESVRLIGEADFLDTLGQPQPYPSALEDVGAFGDIIRSVSSALDNCPTNAAYEGGILYVCARNIAMSASWFSHRGLDFSRQSPLRVSADFGLDFPLAHGEYELLINCRMAGQRGGKLKLPNASFVRDTQRRLQSWAEEVLHKVAHRSGSWAA